jgi:hypothetical protein
MFAPSGHLTSPDDVASVVIRMFLGDRAIVSDDAVLVDDGGASKSWEPDMPTRAMLRRV